MGLNTNLLKVFIVIWIAAAVLNAIRGEWLDLGISLALGGGLLLARDADPNNLVALRRSPRHLAGMAMATLALVAIVIRLAIDVFT